MTEPVAVGLLSSSFDAVGRNREISFDRLRRKMQPLVKDSSGEEAVK